MQNKYIPPKCVKITLPHIRPPRSPWGPLDSGLMRKRSLLSFFFKGRKKDDVL